jgi:hypothetical protein
LNLGTSSAARGAAACCGVLLSMLAAACNRQTLPAPPSRLTRGIVIFADAFYGGQAAYLTDSLPFLRDYNSPCVETSDSGDDPYFSVGSRTWSNCVSSVRVAPGWKAILYGGNNFTGEHLEVTADVPDLREVPGSCGGTFNDCISSIRVSRR